MSELLVFGFLLMGLGLYGRILEGLASALAYNESNRTWGALLFMSGASIVTFWIVWNI